MEAVLVSHNGIGDNFYMLGALNYMSIFYKTVYLLCKDKYYNNVSLFFDEKSNISCIPFDSNEEETEIKRILNDKFNNTDSDIFVCGVHPSNFRRVQNKNFKNDIELHKNDEVLYDLNCSQINNNNYNFIIGFYHDLNLNLNYFFKYYKVPLTEESLNLYEQIKHYSIIFIQLKSSCGRYLNIEKLKERSLEEENTIIICNDINLYPNYEKYNTKRVLADKFVCNKIINYIEVIKQAKEIYLIDSCFIGVVLPLLKTNQLKVDRDKIQIILREHASNYVIY